MNLIQKRRRFLVAGILILPVILIGLYFGSSANPKEWKQPTASPSKTLTITPRLLTATLTSTVSLPAISTATVAPTGAATLAWIGTHEAEVDCPILLYHHVVEKDQDNRYFVSKNAFTAQMEALKNAGYSTVPLSRFLDALISGEELPEKSFVITFDDGYEDVYQNAYPVLKEMGWTATMYLIVNMMDEPNQLTYTQAKELVQAGWEFGSHSMTHVNLTQDYDTLLYEISKSKSILEDKIGVPIETFAYPYGAWDVNVDMIVRKAGYRAGMGLGLPTHHTLKSQYFLSRVEVTHEIDEKELLKLLP